MTAAEVRAHVAERANLLFGRFIYNWDGSGALAVRPDSLRLLMDACNGRPPLIAAPAWGVIVEVTKRGEINVRLQSDGPRTLWLTFADGSTILYQKLFPSGATTRGVICHRMGGEAETAQAVAELTDWLNEE